MSVSTGQVFQATFEPQEIKKKDHTSASVSATSDPSKSNPLKRFITSPPPSTKSNSNSNSSSEFQHSQQVQPYCLVLTHQEKKKRLRMPKRKADSWPSEILSDPDVLSLDDEGRFVLCKVCHVHYAVHGGKKPKPVIMNSSFRTRAWDVHKERTNSHRIQKKQEEMRQRRYDDDRKEEVGSKNMHSNSGNMETNMHPSQYSSLHLQHQRHHPHNNAIDPSRAQQISNELRSPKRKIFRSNGVLPRPWSENGGNSVHQHRLPQVGAPPNGEHQNQHREQRAPNSEYQHQHQHREQRAPNGEYHHQHQHREQRAPTGEHQHQNQLQRDLRAPSVSYLNYETLIYSVLTIFLTL
jgi:hypothetical protein